MDVRSKQTIKEHLQKDDVQERILQYIQKGRDEATVTISRAAELFGITENKLRDWEEYGFLNPLRPSGPKGRRLYTPAELDKLAIIRELIDAGYAASDIPPDIDKQWLATRAPRELAVALERQEQAAANRMEVPELSINQRISQGRGDLFWNYFVSQVLRLSLMLICEDIPHTTAGLILPLQPGASIRGIERIEDVSQLGESLVGWLSQSRSSHVLLTARPWFQYSSDFRVEPLRVIKGGIPQSDSIDGRTLIVIQREARPLTLTSAVVETIGRLLKPLYEDAQRSRECLGRGMRDILSPATDLDSNANYEDVILNGLADMLVHLGGHGSDGLTRWHSCSIFAPTYPTSVLSLQQRSLVVRAQSMLAPTTIGGTVHVPQEPFISNCIKAFQSGHSIYHPDLVVKNSHGGDGAFRSSLAVPVDGIDGTSVAVLHVNSLYPAAFNQDDQRVLRLFGRMISELLETYHARVHAVNKLRAVINQPALADLQFQEFLSEDDFALHVEELLTNIQQQTTFAVNDVVSFIAVDIDNQSGIANKYGDRMARDISRAVGLRIHSQLRAFKDEAEYKLYHICSDRFYILLNAMPLEQVRSKAELLRQTLEGSYQIDPQRSPSGQPTLLETMVVIPNVTVRLGVSSYPYQKLIEVMARYAETMAATEMCMQITGLLEEELALGKQKGGNLVMSWDPTSQGFVRLAR